MQKSLLISAALLGAVAVIGGAFGAHRLKDSLTPDQLSTYETAVKYLFYHVFAIIAAALLYDKTGSNLSLYAGLAFITGIVLFSGSLFRFAFSAFYKIADRYRKLDMAWSHHSYRRACFYYWLGDVIDIGF